MHPRASQGGNGERDRRGYALPQKPVDIPERADCFIKPLFCPWRFVARNSVCCLMVWCAPCYKLPNNHDGDSESWCYPDGSHCRYCR